MSDANRERAALVSAGHWFSLRFRLFGKLDRKAGPEGCWIFTGATNPNLYGTIWSFADQRPILAHRAAWVVTHGPIPSGLHVLHSCDTPPCCNPAHLSLGTPSDNAWDRSRKNRTFNGQKTHCHRGHPFDEVNTYRAKDGGRSCRACWTLRAAERKQKK